MNPQQVFIYYKTMMGTGRIVTITSSTGEMLAFIEFSRINFEQLRHIVSSGEINPSMWDDDGTIIFVSDLYVYPKFKKSGVLNYFKDELLDRNPLCSYMIGQHQNKKSKNFAVHRIHNPTKKEA